MANPMIGATGPGRFRAPQVLGVETTPEVLAVTPNYDRLTGGTSVTITGSRFASDHTGTIFPTVTIGGVAATSVLLVSSTTITCTVPVATDPALVDIVVTNPDGGVATLEHCFTYIQTVILGISPDHGPLAGATSVVITGANFAVVPVVKFGTTLAASVVRIDSQRIVAVTPAHAVGPVDVVVDDATMRGAFFFTLFTRGQDIRRNPSVRISESINAVSSCSFTVDGQSSPPRPGEEFTFHDDAANLMFAGVVQTVEQVYEGLTSQLAWNVSCVDYTVWLNRRRPTGRFANVSATDVIKDLIANFAPWATTTHVQTGLPAVTLDLDGSQDFASVLTTIATMVGNGYWRLDYTKDLHFLLVDELTSSTNGTSAAPITSLGGGQTNPGQITLTQGSVAGNYTPGYYTVLVSFLYDNGAESAPGPISDLVLMDGVHLPHLDSIPIGAVLGGHAVTRRRIYYQMYGYYTGQPLAPFAEIADNVTTTLDSAPRTGLTFAAPRLPVAAPPSSAGRPPSADQTTNAAREIALQYFPGVFASHVAFTYPKGTYEFKYTDVYEDLTESVPTSGSGAVYLDGQHGVRFSTNNHGDDVNGVGVMFRKVYACRSLLVGVPPNWSTDPKSLWITIPNNSNATYEIVPVVKQEALKALSGAQSTATPPNVVPHFDLGVNPETVDNPDDIDDTNTTLLRDPQITVTRDVSQLRNRVIVKGRITYSPTPTAGPTQDDSVDFTQVVDPYANSVAHLSSSYYGDPVAYVRNHPNLGTFQGYPMNATWKSKLFAATSNVKTGQNLTYGGIPVTSVEQYIELQYGISRDYVLDNPYTVFMDLRENYYEAGGGAGVIPVPTATTTLDDLNDAEGNSAASATTTSRPSYQADDLDSQRYMGSIELDSNGNPTDGIHEVVIITDLDTAEECAAFAQAQLAQFAWPIVTVNYATRDPKTHPGRTVHIDLSNPPIQGDYLITGVEIDQVKDEAETTTVLTPRYTVVASDPTKFNLDDLMLLIADGASSEFNLTGFGSRESSNLRQMMQRYAQFSANTSQTIVSALGQLMLNGTCPTIALTRDFSKTDLNSLQLNGPWTIVNNPSSYVPTATNVIWSVLRWWGEKKNSVIYSASPTLSLFYTGLSVGAGVGTIALNLNTTSYQQYTPAQVSFVGAAGTSSMDKGLEMSGNANPTGGGAADNVRITVIVQPIILLGP